MRNAFAASAGRGRIAGMALLLLLAASFAASCIWLTVRVVNQRERWAKRTLAGLIVGMPLMYVLSFGPACWLTARPLRVAPEPAMIVYYPLVDIAHRSASRRGTSRSIPTDRIGYALSWWMRLGVPRGAYAMIPDPAGGGVGARSIDPPPASWQPSPNWRKFDQPIWIRFIVCAIGIAILIWYTPTLLGKSPANPLPRWAVWVRAAGVSVCAFGLALAIYFYLLGW